MKHLTNLELLLALNSYQGGTVHQAAKFYNTTTNNILDLDNAWLSKLLQCELYDLNNFLPVAKDYYKKETITLLELLNMIIGLKLAGHLNKV